MDIQFFKHYLERNLVNLDDYKVTIAEYYLICSDLPTTTIDRLVMNIWNEDAEKFYLTLRNEIPKEDKKNTLAWFNLIEEYHVLSQIEHKLKVKAFREFNGPVPSEEPSVDQQWIILMKELKEVLNRSKFERNVVLS